MIKETGQSEAARDHEEPSVNVAGKLPMIRRSEGAIKKLRCKTFSNNFSQFEVLYSYFGTQLNKN